MKNTLIAFFIATTVALGAVCVVQWQKLAGQKTQRVSLRGEMQQKTREIADLQAAQKLNEKQRQELVQQAADLANKLQPASRPTRKLRPKLPRAVRRQPTAKSRGKTRTASAVSSPRSWRTRTRRK